MKRIIFTFLLTLYTCASAMAQSLNTRPVISSPSGMYDDGLTVTCTFPEGCSGGRYWTSGGEICSTPYTAPITIDRDCTLSVAGTDASGRIITDVVSASYTIRRVTPPSYTTRPSEGRRSESFYVTRLVWSHVGEATLDLSDFRQGGSRYGQDVVTLSDADGRTLATGDVNSLWIDGRNTYKIYFYRNYEQTRPGIYTITIAGGIFCLDGVVREAPIVLQYEVSDESPAPEFSPAEGTYEGSVTVSISYPTDGSAFYPLYKLGGERRPRAYNGPFTLTETTTVEAYGMDDAMTSTTPSATATYVITPAPPTPQTLEAPTIVRDDATKFHLTGPADATLKWWIDDRMSTARLYTAPFTLTTARRISAVAYTSDGISPTVHLDLPDLIPTRIDYGTLTLVTPLIAETAHLRGLSANGRYAVGYTGNDTSSRGFIWDLESDDMAYAQTPYINQLWSVADDGTAFGWRTREVEVDETAGDDAFFWGAFSDGSWTEMTADEWATLTGASTLSHIPSGYPAATHVSSNGEWAILGDAYRYHVTTGKIEALPSTRTSSSSPRPEVLTAIANDGLIFGTYDPTLLSPESGTGLVYTLDGRWRDVADWLYDTYGVIPPDDFALTAVCAVTGDHTTLLCHTRRRSMSTADAFTRGLVLRIDTQIAHLAPVAVSARQIPGLETIRVSWSAPVSGAADIVSYTLLRDGTAIATLDAGIFCYYDDDVTSGATYTYALTAEYADGSSSAFSREAIIQCDLVSHLPVHDLNTRRIGLADLMAEWQAPLFTMPRLQYFDESIDHYAFGTGIYSAEFGVRFSADDLAPFRDSQVRTFQFIPTGPQRAYTLNLYHGRTGKSIDYDTRPYYTQEIDPATLHYGAVNTIILDTPQDLPAEGDLFVSLLIETAGNDNMLGVSYEGFRSGYTDLCRIVGVHSQMVAISQNSSVATELVLPLGLGLSDEAGFAANVVSEYDVTLDDTPVATTTSLRQRFSSLAPCLHTIGVTARYLDGRTSIPVTTTVDLIPDEEAYAAITPRVAPQEDHTALITWDAPRDDDRTLMHWGDLTPSGGWEMARGSSCYVATVAFPATMTAPYAGEYAITDVFFCPLADVLFYLTIENPDGEQLAYAAPTSVKVGEINTFRLNEPLVVDPSMTYHVAAYAVTAEEGTCAVAYDSSGHWQNGYSNLINYGQGNSTLADFVQYDQHPNWILGMVLRETDAALLPVEGYQVRLGDEVLTPSLIQEESFTTPTLADGDYTVSIDVAYANGPFVPGAATSFSMDITGVRPITLTVQPGTRLFDLSGRRTGTHGTRGLHIDSDGRKAIIH